MQQHFAYRGIVSKKLPLPPMNRTEIRQKARREAFAKIRAMRFKTNAALSEALGDGFAPSYVSQLLSGHRGIGDDVATKIEDRLELPRGWLDQDHDERADTEPGPNIQGSVPLISWVQAGEYAEIIDHLAPGEGERIETTVPIKAHTYALRVSGDSMEPEFPEGCIIIVEPEMEPRHGDYVIVRNGSNEATFKQLIQDGADCYLKPINPRYPVKQMPKGAVFCGVVRGMERRFR